MAGTRPFSPGPLFKDQNPARPGVKRRNPFATIENTYSPQKKLFIYDEHGGNGGPVHTEWAEKDGNDVTTAKEGSASSDRLMEVRRMFWTKYVVFVVWSLI